MTRLAPAPESTWPTVPLPVQRTRSTGPRPADPRRTRGPGRRSRAVGPALVVVAAVLVALVVAQLGYRRSAGEVGTDPARQAPIGIADGLVPDGVTVFDDDYPAVSELDPALRSALRRAAEEATDDGVTLVVNSGWRSRAHQEQLLREAVATHGSRAEAARWVATPDTSAHVSGDAVDIGPAGAARWLATHGYAYGLCRIYDNEPWHFELRPAAVRSGCPARFPDPTHDPRTQR